MKFAPIKFLQNLFGNAAQENTAEDNIRKVIETLNDITGQNKDWQQSWEPKKMGEDLCAGLMSHNSELVIPAITNALLRETKKRSWKQEVTTDTIFSNRLAFKNSEGTEMLVLWLTPLDDNNRLGIATTAEVLADMADDLKAAYHSQLENIAKQKAEEEPEADDSSDNSFASDSETPPPPEGPSL